MFHFLVSVFLLMMLSSCAAQEGLTSLDDQDISLHLRHMTTLSDGGHSDTKLAVTVSLSIAALIVALIAVSILLFVLRRIYTLKRRHNIHSSSLEAMPDASYDNVGQYPSLGAFQSVTPTQDNTGGSNEIETFHHPTVFGHGLSLNTTSCLLYKHISPLKSLSRYKLSSSYSLSEFDEYSNTGSTVCNSMQSLHSPPPLHSYDSAYSSNSECSSSSHTPSSEEKQILLSGVSHFGTESNWRDVCCIAGPPEFVTFTSEGGVYYSPSHEVSLSVPAGAVPGNQTITVKVGFTLHTPIELPQNRQPVSAIVSFCVTDDPEFRFLKAVEITLPHYLTLLDTNESRYVFFMKAGHDSTSFHDTDGQSTFEPHKSYGVLSTDHFCFFCIAKDIKQTDTSKANYCLMRAVPKLPSGPQWDIYFCVTYLLPTCISLVKEQFKQLPEAYELLSKKFNFAMNSLNNGSIEIHFSSELSSGWMLARQNATKITAEDVNFWSSDVEELKLMQEELIYPPRFRLTVVASEAQRSARAVVTFTGSVEDLNTEVPLLLAHQEGLARKPGSTRSLPEDFKYGQVSIERLNTQPTHSQLMNYVAVPALSKWREIALQLGQSKCSLDAIAQERHGDTKLCFSDVLENWRTNMAKPYTWQTIINALHAPLVQEHRLAEETEQRIVHQQL